MFLYTQNIENTLMREAIYQNVSEHHHDKLCPYVAESYKNLFHISDKLEKLFSTCVYKSLVAVVFVACLQTSRSA